MAGKIGVWIDHRKAILVRFNDGVEVVREIDSDAEKHVRDAGGSGSGASHGSQDVVAGDKRDRKFMNHLNTYYDQVIQQFEHTEGIVILGPGEAKGELAKRLSHEKPASRRVNVESSDKMTDRQIAARVREHFQSDTPVIMLR